LQRPRRSGLVVGPYAVAEVVAVVVASVDTLAGAKSRV
jgi:hypothetical protein